MARETRLPPADGRADNFVGQHNLDEWAQIGSMRDGCPLTVGHCTRDADRATGSEGANLVVHSEHYLCVEALDARQEDGGRD
jgi:hypothetical protein